MKASCGTFVCAKQLIMVTEKKTIPKIGMDSNSEERNFAEIRGRGLLKGRGRREKDRSLVMPRKRLL